MCDVLLQDDVYDLYRLLESCAVQRRKFFEKPRALCHWQHKVSRFKWVPEGSSRERYSAMV